jgi:hypothetical protein
MALGRGLGLAFNRAGPQVTYSAEATTLFAAMSVQPNSALKKAYNDCIVSLKAQSLWTKLDALYLMDVHDAQAARLNVKSPGTYDLTATNSPTFTAKSGYAGNGSSAYLDTNCNPFSAGGNYSTNSASAFVWSTKAAQDGGGAMGRTSTPTGRIYPRFTDDSVRSNVGAAVIGTVATGAGLTHGNASGASAQQIYKDGASNATGATASSLPTGNLVLLREQAAFFSGTLAMAGFGGSLSGTDAANLFSILSTFKTAAEAS